MDDSERLAADYLASKGYKSIVYEPDGNVPPDFLVDGRIAVEVRRLNQNYQQGSDSRGLEEVSIPLWHRMKKFVKEFGPPTLNESWFVFYGFSRPLPEWRQLRECLRATLSKFAANPIYEGAKFEPADNFRLEIFRASKPYDSFFVMGGHTDEESGGWLIGELEKNIKICIEEKSRKISKVRARYPEWWLLLIDQVAYGLDGLDREIFEKEVRLEHDWDRIVLLHPHDHDLAYEIPKAG